MTRFESATTIKLTVSQWSGDRVINRRVEVRTLICAALCSETEADGQIQEGGTSLFILYVRAVS